jgi:hypothetical protein
MRNRETTTESSVTLALRAARGRRLMACAVAVAFGVLLLGVAPMPAWGRCEVSEWAGIAASDASAIDEFGISAAASGDTAIIGAYWSDVEGPAYGSAYVYRYDGVGWIEEVELTAPDAEMNDEFGISVGISGGVAVVGSHYDDDACPSEPHCDSGSAYVFQFDGVNWSQVGKLTASDAAESDNFGWSVAIDGDWIVVGANLDDGVGGNSGSAYLFAKPAGGWTDMTETAKVTAADSTTNDEFGKSVAISGDVIVVGAHYQAGGAAFQGGAAYVFAFDGATWNQEAKLTASDAADIDRFGLSVSISGDVALVGAWANDDEATQTGSAYVFEKPVGGWTDMTETVMLRAWDGAAGNHFGWSVSLNGDVAVIGAPANLFDGTGPGSAYVFLFDGFSWSGQAKLVSSDGVENSQFGYSTAVTDQGFGIIGASRHPTGGYMNAGAAYAFHGLSDCNITGLLDVCDIADGASQDADGDGFPDECELPGDLDGDGDVDIEDFGIFAGCMNGPGDAYPLGCDAADLDIDGDADLADFAAFQALFRG